LVVLFDVDGTLVGVNCTAALLKALTSDGVVPRSSLASLAIEQILYRLKCRSFPALMASAYGLLQGCDISRVEACVERVVAEVVMPALYPEAVARIAMHRARGDRVVLASAAPAVVIERVGWHVGVSAVIASDFERIGRRFGPVNRPQAYGAGKVELAGRAGLLDAGPPHVYTDHAEDWPLVLASGFATLVNPARRLVRDTRRHGIAHEVAHWGCERVNPAAAPLEPRTPAP
jgi:HAD superfamily hydrolase (TIGR01490 family)